MRQWLRGSVWTVVLAWLVFGCMSCSSRGGVRNLRISEAIEWCSVRVGDLTCEYLVDPLGIDVVRPRLSWKLRAKDSQGHGQRQKAYRVIVASSESVLRGGRGDLWDSGVVYSDRSVLVEYDGKGLGARQRCYWKVKVQDQTGGWSPWSEVSRWTMGLLSESDWAGKWIGSDKVFVRAEGWPPPDNTVADPWLRKTFDIGGEIADVFVYVASIGYHELYVNGEKVGDTVLAPSVANHRKRARYVTYEISDKLVAGRNVIALWLGTSWSIFPPYKSDDRPATPIVMAQAEISLADGGRVTIATDKSWKTHESPNTLMGVWDFMHYGGELYDANKEIAGWNSVGLDDSGWAAATEYSPQVVVSAEKVEPNRLIKRVAPVGIENLGEGKYRVDMGVNMSGWMEADVAGEPGQVIEFKFSEDHEKEMTHRLHSKYVIGPTGKGTFGNRFNYFCGRWIQIEGLDYKPEFDDIRCDMIRTDYGRVGHFKSSNELLNDIYDTTLWTFENLSLGGYVVDCPQRERMGYGGDAHATTDCGLSNYDLGAFYTKWIEDWRDVQYSDGNLPYTAPTYWGGGGPGWSGYCVTLPAKIYERYGDVRILEENFPMMQRWLGFLENKAQDDMLVRWGGEWDFLGDWLWPGADGVNGDTPETLFFNNCYWIYNLQTASEIANLLGKADVSKRYRERAEEVRRAVHKKFFNAADNSYANGFQGYLSIALMVDLPPEEVRAAVWKRLEDEILVKRKGHIHAGITAGYFVTENLLDAHRNDLLFEMTNKRTYPSFGNMLDKDATTMWEAWEGHNSLLHSSYLWIGTWFIEGLGGIEVDPSSPGMQRFIIRPGIVDHRSLRWVEADYESMYGRIESRWRIDGKRLVVEAVVPPNTSATLYMPTDWVGSVSPSSGAGIVSVRMVSGAAAIVLEPGRYRFEATYK